MFKAVIEGIERKLVRLAARDPAILADVEIYLDASPQCGTASGGERGWKYGRAPNDPVCREAAGLARRA
jgi:hypothetical protein